MGFRKDTETDEDIPTGKQDTSIESAEETAKKKNKYRQIIYEEILFRGGLTCDEIETSLGLRHQTASCFIRFLTQDEMLFNSGEKRITRAGRKAIVWKVKNDKTVNAKQINLF